MEAKVQYPAAHEKKMILTVLFNQEQYQSLLSSFSKPDELKILCANPSLYDFLAAKNIKFEPLEEDCIKEKWENINIWACEKALFWNNLLDDNARLFNGVELNKALYVYFSYYLAYFLKNYLFADFIYKRYNPSRVVVFDDASSPDFPELSGNYFLNLFLKDFANRHKSEIISMGSKPKSNFNAAISAKGKIRAFIQNAYPKSIRTHKKGKTFIVSGALRQLAPVIKELKNTNQNLFLFDLVFNFEKFRFSLKKNLQYLIPGCFIKGDTRYKADNFSYKEDFMKAVGILRSKQWFKYGDVDLSGFVCDELLSRATPYLQNISLWSHIYQNIINTYDLKGLVVDEDWTPKGAFMAAFFKSRGINTFCVSHGYGPVIFSLRDSARIFFLSETFVHSEYEKLLYSSKGWDANHIHITGIPRYDRLIRLKKRKKAKNNKKMKILFCGTVLTDYILYQKGYVGNCQSSSAFYTRVCLRDIIRAIDGYNIELIVRPHEIKGEEFWRKFIRNNKRRNNIYLRSHAQNFFDLLSQCDAMFLGYWSTAIIESAIFGIPVVLLDYSGLEGRHPFAREGLCTMSHNLEELKEIVKELYTSFISGRNSKYKPVDIEAKGFYTGINDGGNTYRVAEKIINKPMIGQR